MPTPGEPLELRTPLGLPPVPVPPDNPLTAAVTALGRRLFYDVRLSSDDTVACANCHNPAIAFTDGLINSSGVKDRMGTRNAPTVLNVAYFPLLFRDGRARGLEEQAVGPIENPLEMNQPRDKMVARIGSIADYRGGFERAFGPGPVTLEKVEKALAGFERTLVSGNSPFDRYFYGGDKKALSAAAIRGLALFRDKGKGNCATCHTIEEHYALFTDNKFHNLGVGVPPDGKLSDEGRYLQTHDDSDHGAFRTPSLRNVAKTEPYMHDGSLKTLKQVVEFYDEGGINLGNPHLDKEIRSLHLSGRERNDLVAFLESLTGDVPPDSGPPNP
jgi:cytochrome c peroxidase